MRARHDTKPPVVSVTKQSPSRRGVVTGLWAACLLAACEGSDLPPGSIGTSTDGGILLDGGTSADGGSPVGGGASTDWTAGDPLPAPDRWWTAAALALTEVRDASFDAAGNLWAVDARRLSLLRAGTLVAETFSASDGLSPDEILCVAAGPAGIAWVGHSGVGDDTLDPPSMRESGGVDAVDIRSGTLRTRHIVLGSPPGMYAAYPLGRYKLRTVQRALAEKQGPGAGEAWFGANHGVALVAANGWVLEHHHPTVCLQDPGQKTCTVRAGDVPVVAFDRRGGVWMGGTYGATLVQYDDGGQRQFWGPEPIRNLVVFDPPRRPNRFGSQDVTGIATLSTGDAWFASAHSGLARRASDGTLWVLGDAQGLPSTDLVDLTADGQDRLWLATASGAAWVLDVAARRWHRVPEVGGGVRRVVFEQLPTGPRIVVVSSGGVAVYEASPTVSSGTPSQP